MADGESILQHRTKLTRERAAIMAPPPTPELQSFKSLRRYLTSGQAPWRRVARRRSEILCDASRISEEDVTYGRGRPFPLKDYRFVQPVAFRELLRRRFVNEITADATDGFADSNPDQSARRILSPTQKTLLTISILAVALAFAHAPLFVIIAFNIVVTAYFLFAVIYRFFLLIISLNPKTPKTTPLSPDQLPTVTILVPLYDEAKSVSRLLRSLRALDYPQEKLDIKLLLEGDDRNTIEEVRRHKLDDHFDVLLIPPCPPRTKPKACNFGLRLARGDLIVIYDAEDRPEPDQIQKAASAFHKADDDLACVQAKLNYYNKHENWLTRLFTLEYSLWFDWLLPALQELRAPIPLGGTSNFFRTDKLIEIGGWDPYNVTEDADIGIRISKLGYRVEIIDSTTFEEANCRLGNWVRQRSRWMKGYLQTWLVHMRKPHEIIRSSGWGGFLSLQLFVAGNIFSAIINPVLWTTTLIWLFTRTDAIAAAFPGPLLDLNMIALVAGNSFFVALSVIAPLRRGWFGLAAYGLTAPIYWLLTSIAAYKALWQIVLRPHYWEKTEHAISKSFDRE